MKNYEKKYLNKNNYNLENINQEEPIFTCFVTLKCITVDQTSDKISCQSVSERFFCRNYKTQSQ